MYNVRTYEEFKKGQAGVTIADDVLNTTSFSIGLPGDNLPAYSTAFAEMLIWATSNFAYTKAPLYPIIGQLWYNTSNQTLNVCSDNTTNTPTWDEVTSTFIDPLKIEENLLPSKTNNFNIGGATISDNNYTSIYASKIYATKLVFGNITIDKNGYVVKTKTSDYSHGTSPGTITSELLLIEPKLRSASKSWSYVTPTISVATLYVNIPKEHDPAIFDTTSYNVSVISVYGKTVHYVKFTTESNYNLYIDIMETNVDFQILIYAPGKVGVYSYPEFNQDIVKVIPRLKYATVADVSIDFEGSKVTSLIATSLVPNPVPAESIINFITGAPPEVVSSVPQLHSYTFLKTSNNGEWDLVYNVRNV